MKVLVTGASGFVGGHVARVLKGAGLDVRALVRPGSITWHIQDLGLEMAQGDVRDVAAVRGAVRGCQGVFHVAALYAFWARDRRAFHDTNVVGTRNVMQAALDEGVQRVVHTSTVAVLGSPQRGQALTEESQPRARDLTGPYRSTKYLAEREALGFVARGLDVVAVNPTAPVGRGDVKPTPTGRMILDFLRGRLPAYIDAHLNIVDVEDVAVGHLLAWQKGRTGQRYLLGNRNMTMKEILEALARITSRRAPRLRIPLWLALALGHVDAVLEGAILRKEPLIPLEGVQHAWRPRPVDCSKALRELGFPQTPVEQALEKAVRWFREHGYVP